MELRGGSGYNAHTLELCASNETEKSAVQIKPKDQVPYWLEYIEYGRDSPIASLLLMLLPNVSTLKLDGLGNDEHCFISTLCHITSMKGAGAPLSCLSHVQIPEPRYSHGLSLLDHSQLYLP